MYINDIEGTKHDFPIYVLKEINSAVIHVKLELT